jgi:uncharacterized membrane protein
MIPLKRAMQWLLAALFLGAGVLHFLTPSVFVRIVPPYLPWPRELVYVSGACELVLGTLLLVRRYTVPAAWGVIALLIAVFPANVHMALNASEFPVFPVTVWYSRLPLQAVLIVWAYWLTRPPN